MGLLWRASRSTYSPPPLTPAEQTNRVWSGDTHIGGSANLERCFREIYAFFACIPLWFCCISSLISRRQYLETTRSTVLKNGTCLARKAARWRCPYFGHTRHPATTRLSPPYLQHHQWQQQRISSPQEISSNTAAYLIFISKEMQTEVTHR